MELDLPTPLSHTTSREKCQCSHATYSHKNFIVQSNNTFGGLLDFVSPNPLEVTNTVGDNLSMENWEK
jgi:hypothetical protein